MHVLYVTDGYKNPGDHFSYLGARRVMQSAFQVAGEQAIVAEHFLISEARRQIAPPDLVVLAGAPWLWDQGGTSEKYRAFVAILEAFPEAAKIAIGIGSGFLPSLFSSVKEPGFRRNSGIANFASFDFVSVRDSLAQSCFQLEGIPSMQIPDPAWLGVSLKPPRERNENLVIATDSEKLFIAPYLDQESKDDWNSIVSAEVEAGATRWGWNSQDSDFPGMTSDGPRATLKRLSQAKSVVTNRVHAAVLARSLGIETSLFAIDSRALTASAVGAKILGNFPHNESLQKYSIRDRSGIVRAIGRKIRNSLQDKLELA